METLTPIRFAIWCGTAAVAVVVGMTLAMIAVRGMETVSRRRRAHLVDKWKDLLQRGVADLTAFLPALPARHASDLLAQWNEVFETLPSREPDPAARAHAADVLRQIGRRVHLAEAAYDRLTAADRPDRLEAARALGHLRAASSWTALEPASREADPYVSYAALEAMLRIDPDAARAPLMRQVLTREAWPGYSAARLIDLAGAGTVEAIVAAWALTPSSRTAVRLFIMLEHLHRREAADVLDWLFDHAVSEAELLTVLHHARHTGSRPSIQLRLAEHQRRALQLAGLAEGAGVGLHAARHIQGLIGHEPPWVRALVLSRLQAAPPGSAFPH